MLALAGREADIVGINPAIPKGYVDASVASEVIPSTLQKKVDLLRSAVPDRFDDLELNILVFATDVGPSAPERRDATAQMFGVTPEDLDASPYAWVGSASDVADQLRAARDRWGTSYFVVQGEAAMEQAAPVVASLAGT